MKFYPVTVNGVPQLARTKDEAKAFGPVPEPIEIDMSQPAIMARLNDLMRKAHGQQTIQEQAPVQADADGGESPAPVHHAENVAPLEMSASAIISRMDIPNADGVVQAIMKAKGHALGRFARCVAQRFEELAK